VKRPLGIAIAVFRLNAGLEGGPGHKPLVSPTREVFRWWRRRRVQSARHGCRGRGRGCNRESDVCAVPDAHRRSSAPAGRVCMDAASAARPGRPARRPHAERIFCRKNRSGISPIRSPAPARVSMRRSINAVNREAAHPAAPPSPDGQPSDFVDAVPLRPTCQTAFPMSSFPCNGRRLTSK